MSNNIYLPPFFKSVIIALFTFAVLFIDSITLGQNPVSGSIPVSVRVTLGILVEDFEVYVPCQAYDAANLPWNGVNTRTNKKPITNFLTSGLTFPIKPAVTGLSYDITTSHVNDRFDPLHPASAGWTKFGSPTMKSNCHGYSTLYNNCWLNDFSVIVGDDYVPRETAKYLKADAVFGSDHHSVKIEGITRKMENGEMKTAIYKIGEKINASAIYQRNIENANQVFYEDDDSVSNIGTFYVPK